jgi:hypothetical protein
MDLQGEARIKAAQAAVSEAKARLSNGYAIALLKMNGNNVSVTQAAGNANIAAGSWGDFTVGVVATADPAVITVSQAQGVALSTNVVGYWNLPTP